MMSPKVRRALVTGALAVAALSVIPAPAAVAAKPFREQIRGFVGEYEVIPAGEPCPFPVGLHVEGQGMNMQFSDERGVSNNQGTFFLTNLETGGTYTHESRYHYTSDWKLGGEFIHDVVDGKYSIPFFPGEPGPEGEVGPNGAWYFVEGRMSIVFDAETSLITSFTLTGRYVDACAVLAAAEPGDR